MNRLRAGSQSGLRRSGRLPLAPSWPDPEPLRLASFSRHFRNESSLQAEQKFGQLASCAVAEGYNLNFPACTRATDACSGLVPRRDASSVTPCRSWSAAVMIFEQ